VDAARAKLSQLTKQEYVAYYSQVWHLSGDNSNRIELASPSKYPTGS